MPPTKPNKYVARIYGFKVFGMKSSKYEGMQLPPGEEKKPVDEKEKEKEKEVSK